jgi:thymidylate synthase (FAD)
MDVKLISITPDSEKTMAYCARVSSPHQDKPEYAGLFKYCLTHGHWSIFETCNMVVEIQTSRAISAQILRHRSFSFQEFSQRYAAVDDSGVEIYAARRQDVKNRQNSIDDLPEEIKKEWEARQLQNWRSSFEHYQWALDNGIAKECARFVLPLGCSTKIYMNGTIRSWIHYIQLRSGNGTQKEHMDIANEIKDVFIQQLPTVAEALGWTRVSEK